VAADKKTATALLYFQLYSQRAADKKTGGGKSASAQPIFRIPGCDCIIQRLIQQDLLWNRIRSKPAWRSNFFYNFLTALVLFIILTRHSNQR